MFFQFSYEYVSVGITSRSIDSHACFGGTYLVCNIHRKLDVVALLRSVIRGHITNMINAKIRA